MNKHISSITGLNIKGLSFTHSLSPATVIIGDNMEGKTAVLDALKIALLGTHPALDQTNAGTWMLAAQDQDNMEVEVVLGNKVGKRTWAKKADGSITRKDSVPFETPPVLIDRSDYFSQKKADRINRIAGLADWEKYGYSDEDLLAKVANIEVSAKSVEIFNQAIKGLRDNILARRNKGTPLPVWFESVIAGVAAAKKAADVNLKNMEPMPPIPPGERPQDASEAIKSHAEAIRGLLTDLQRLGGDPCEALKRCERARASLELSKAKKADLEQKQKSIEEQRKKLLGQPSRAELARELVNAKTSLRSVESLIGNLQSAIQETNELLAEENGPDCCPRCNRGGKAWKAILAKEKVAARDRLSDCEKKLGDNVAAQKELESKAAELTSKIATVDKQSRELAEADKCLSEVILDIKDIELDIEGRLQPEIEAAEAAHAKAVESESARKAATEALAQKQAELQALNEKQSDFRQYQNIKNRRAAIEQGILENHRRSEFYKAYLECLIQTQKEIVDACFNRVLDKARLFTDGIIGGKLGYQDGEFGMVRDSDGLWVNHRTLSMTQQTLAYAGFCVALATDAPVKIVMIDEMGVVKDHRKALLVNRMIELIEQGVIDQFVGVDVESKTYEPYQSVGLKIIHL